MASADYTADVRSSVRANGNPVFLYPRYVVGAEYGGTVTVTIPMTQATHSLERQLLHEEEVEAVAICKHAEAVLQASEREYFAALEEYEAATKAYALAADAFDLAKEEFENLAWRVHTFSRAPTPDLTSQGENTPRRSPLES